MANATNSAWTVERIADLERLHASGLSASAIGGIIGFSRNAVIGKIHRMNLAPPRIRVSQPRTETVSRKHTIKRLHAVNGNRRVAKAFAPIETAEYQLRCVEVALLN